MVDVAHPNLPLEVARLLNHEWYRWSTQRRVRAFRGGIYARRYQGKPYTVSRFVKFPEPYSTVRAAQYRKPAWHLPKRALTVSRGDSPLATRVAFWCGSATTLPEWHSLVGIDAVCAACLWREERGHL